MNNSRWQEMNEQFLSSALAWLRLLLRSASDPDTGSHPIQEAEETVLGYTEQPDQPALVLLQQALGLDRFERDLLLLCSASELDPAIPALCASAQENSRLPYPTFGLALTLFKDPTWNAISPRGALRYWRLIEISQSSGQPLTTSTLRADERIVSYIKGLNYLDDRLDPILTAIPAPIDPGSLPLSQRTVSDSIVDRCTHAELGVAPSVVQLVGADVAAKQMIAAHVAADLGRSLYSLPYELLPEQPAELENLARLWSRESILLPIALYVDAHDLAPGSAGDPRGPGAARFLARTGGLVFLGTRDAWAGLPYENALFEVGRPTQAEQRSIWLEALGDDRDEEFSRHLASQFSLNAHVIRQVATSARGHLTSDDSTTGEPALADARLATLRSRLWNECLVGTRPRMETLAQRIDARARWSDIVLPAAELALLKQIASHVQHRSTVYEDWGFGAKMNRGLGISALFAGASGTGKSMAAEVIANALRLTLYRIDLSAVVSKYIGETERNLRRVFDAAEEGGGLLFFDEADALFGKRSEVKDSHDRYANIEINYLLQRMESYRGLAILATNMKGAMDTAFLRRLRFIVNFPFPSLAQRRQIWQKMFPEATPTDALDWDRLASLPASGGMIHNIALNAAFLSAREAKPVSMEIILECAQSEFRKLELPVLEREFSWSPQEVVSA